jgi:hypothetical protein
MSGGYLLGRTCPSSSLRRCQTQMFRRLCRMRGSDPEQQSQTSSEISERRSMDQWRAQYEQERLLNHAAPEIFPAFVELTAISRRIGEQLREPMYRHLQEVGIAWSEMEDKLC